MFCVVYVGAYCELVMLCSWEGGYSSFEERKPHLCRLAVTSKMYILY
jgi:hypothetical protein